jgi:hypothetical protein
MKKLTMPAIGLAAILCACPLLQSCADTSSQTTYTTTSDGSPVAQTTTTTTTTNAPDSIVGSTAHAAGTIVAAPFEIVGDTLGIIF